MVEALGIIIDRRPKGKPRKMKLNHRKNRICFYLPEMLQSTKPTIRAYFREGEIKGQKITGKWYITEDNFKKYLSGDYPILTK